MSAHGVCGCAEMERDMPVSAVVHRIILRIPFFEDIVFFVKPIQRCNCEDNPVCYLIAHGHVTVM